MKRAILSLALLALLVPLTACEDSSLTQPLEPIASSSDLTPGLTWAQATDSEIPGTFPLVDARTLVKHLGKGQCFLEAARSKSKVKRYRMKLKLSKEQMGVENWAPQAYSLRNPKGEVLYRATCVIPANQDGIATMVGQVERKSKGINLSGAHDPFSPNFDLSAQGISFNGAPSPSLTSSADESGGECVWILYIDFEAGFYEWAYCVPEIVVVGETCDPGLLFDPIRDMCFCPFEECDEEELGGPLPPLPPPEDPPPGGGNGGSNNTGLINGTAGNFSFETTTVTPNLFPIQNDTVVVDCSGSYSTSTLAERARKAYCHANQPTPTHESRIEAALERILERGEECEAIGQLGYTMLSQGRIRIFQRDSAGSLAGLAQNNWILLSSLWTDTLYDLDPSRVGKVTIGGVQYDINLDYALAHELEHRMGKPHTDSTQLFTENTKKCSGLYFPSSG